MAYDYTGGTGMGDFFGAAFATMKKLRTLQTDLDTRRTTIEGKITAAHWEYADDLFKVIKETQALLSEQARKMAEPLRRYLEGTIKDEAAAEAMGIPNVIEQLREMMLTDSQSFDDETVSSSVAALGPAGGSNTGDATLIVGTVNGRGETQIHARAEKLYAKCIEDAQGPGSLDAGKEVFLLTGEPVVDRFDKDFPGGSGTKAYIVCTHGGEEQRSGPGKNLLLDGEFENWDGSNTPDNWDLDTGSAGTHIFQEGGGFRGSYQGSFQGDAGGTKPKISQSLNGVAGMKLKPQTVYAISIHCKDGTTPATAGNLRLSLQDGAGSLLNATSKVDIDCDTEIGAAWANYSAAIYTPADIPADAEIVLEFTVAIGDGEDVVFDEVTLQEMFQPHPGGPYFAIAAGATDCVQGDVLQATIANGAANDEFVLEMDRAFNIYPTGVVLPTDDAGGETIADALIA